MRLVTLAILLLACVTGVTPEPTVQPSKAPFTVNGTTRVITGKAGEFVYITSIQAYSGPKGLTIYFGAGPSCLTQGTMLALLPPGHFRMGLDDGTAVVLVVPDAMSLCLRGNARGTLNYERF